MSQYPFVAVKRVDGEIKDSLTGLYDPMRIDFGGRYNLSALLNEVLVNGIITQLREMGGPVYLLVWEGSKIPHGAKILGHEIGWTQNGIVGTIGGKDIGTYHRLVEFGGKTRNLQVMMIYIYPTVQEIAS